MRRATGMPSFASGWWLPAFLATVLATHAAALPAAPTTIESADLAPTADGTRFTLDLSGTSAAAVFTLDSPPRVVIDLKGARVERRRPAMPAPQGLVRHVRTGPRDGGVVRIVLELTKAAHVRSLPLAATHAGTRLVVDLSPIGPAAIAHAPARTVVAPPVVTVAPKPVERATVPSNSRDLVIAVDAGHGGDDPGATGRDGTREKDVTLAVAKVLAARIGAEPGMRAVLIRNRDVFVPLRERIDRARTAQADLFVSVHADAVLDRSVAGSSVYVLSQRGATSEAAKWLADRENSADLVGGVSLDDKDTVLASVLLDLSQSAAMSASMTAAEKVLDQLNQVGEVRKAHVQQAGFVVLKSPDIPSMLIESAYITNPGEERRLRDPRHQSQLADAILAGIRNYFHEYPPPGTKLAALAAATTVASSMGQPPRALPR